MMADKTLTFTKRDGHSVAHDKGVWILRIERPEKANALNIETCRAMSDSLDEFQAAPDMRVAIITGAGKHFCAGMDLGMVQPGERIILPKSGFGGLTARWLEKPVIAAIHGVAFGGGFELAIACDLIVADPTARFCLPEARVGQAALAGGLARLPSRIGMPRALDMALTCRQVAFDEAHSWGLVARKSPNGEALSTALTLAYEIAHNAPLSLKCSKTLLNQQEAGLSDAQCARVINIMLDSEDAVEGAKAFLEKRTPKWRGQ